MTPPAARSRLRHDAFFYAGEDELAATVVPFVREGVERGEVVLVNTEGNPVTGLLKAVFTDEPSVRFAEGAYAKPVSVIDRYQRAMGRGSRPEAAGFRAVGYIDFDRGHLPWREWLRYEAVSNRVFADYPLRALCPYSTDDLAPEIVAAMRSAHPTLLEGGRQKHNPEYVEPASLVVRPDLRTPPDPVQAAEPTLELADVRDLRTLRMDVYPAMFLTRVPRDGVDDFVKAVGEVATNAWTHGARPVRLRLWVAPDRLVCTVTDQGPGVHDPLRGYARPGQGSSRPSPEGTTREGLGLWAARQLVDVLDYERTDEGFTVRLVTYWH